MGLGGASKLVVAGICGCIALVILTIVLIAISVKSIETNEVGLALDGFSQSISTKLYTGGTYFLGPAYHFEKYPTTQETIAYSDSSSSTGSLNGPSVPARTSDGLPITVSYSFNYQLRTTYDDILGLYLNYGSADFTDVLYQRISKNVVRTVAGEFPASQFFINKEVVRLQMFNQLSADLGAVSASLSSFNLISVGVPPALSNAIARQQNAAQDVVRAQNDLLTAQINALARVQANQTQAALIVSGAQVAAQKTQQALTQKIASLNARYDAERTSYLALKRSLNMTTDELLRYIWLDAQSEGVASQVGSSSIIAFDSPMSAGLSGS